MSIKQLGLDGIGSEDAATRVGRATFKTLLDAKRANPSFRTTEAALIDAIRPHVLAELPKAKRVGGRNVLFDALAAGCGLTAPFTKSAAGQVAQALKEILEVQPGVAADELTRVAKDVLKKYDGAGPKAVSAHWGEFAASHKRKAGPAHPVAPLGWLATLNRLFPESAQAKGGMFEIEKETDYQFARLDAEVRNAILEAMR